MKNHSMLAYTEAVPYRAPESTQKPQFTIRCCTIHSSLAFPVVRVYRRVNSHYRRAVHAVSSTLGLNIYSQTSVTFERFTTVLRTRCLELFYKFSCCQCAWLFPATPSQIRLVKTCDRLWTILAASITRAIYNTRY